MQGGEKLKEKCRVYKVKGRIKVDFCGKTYTMIDKRIAVVIKQLHEEGRLVERDRERDIK